MAKHKIYFPYPLSGYIIIYLVITETSQEFDIMSNGMKCLLTLYLDQGKQKKHGKQGKY